MTAPNFGSPITLAFGRVLGCFTLSSRRDAGCSAVLARWLVAAQAPAPLVPQAGLPDPPGMQVETRGGLSRRHPTLYVANHVSYLDIEVLGALAKAVLRRQGRGRDLAVLLLAGQAAGNRLRRAPAQRTAAEHRDEMSRRLEAGDDLILFPEGTSGDGNEVLPFKSALFSVAERRPHGEPTVQPVSIAYTRLDGLPLGRYLRPFFAWYGDMELGNHLWHAISLGRVTVVVEKFHEPVTMEQFGSRKALSDHCYDVVSRRSPRPCPAARRLLPQRQLGGAGGRGPPRRFDGGRTTTGTGSRPAAQEGSVGRRGTGAMGWKV